MSVKKAKLVERDLTFLVVDDDELARRTIVEYLRSFGYKKIFEAGTGKEALRIFEDERIDFVLSDWDMPEASGLDLLRALKTDERLSKIPFIMVTSPISEEKHKIADAAIAKVDDYIIKPFRSDVLRVKIEKLISMMPDKRPNGVLVVDDDKIVRSTVVEYLQRMGYDPIFEASDGDEGFAALQIHQKTIAFVVSDWEMPRLAGIELLKKIRSDESLKEMPFIMITSQASIERIKVRQAIEADVDHYLLKPFKGEELKAKVHEVLTKNDQLMVLDRFFQKAEGHALSAQWIEASKAYNNIIKRDPTNTRAFLGLANAQRRLAPEKAIPNATQYIRAAIKINPKCVQAYIDLALIFESAMSLEKAINALKDAIKECPFSEEIHYHLGRLLLRRGNKMEAIATLKKALELRPDYQEAQDLLLQTPQLESEE